MTPNERSVNSERQPIDDAQHLVVYGDLTATEFLELWTACLDIGPADAAYLLGYPMWRAGPNWYVFTGEGPDA